MLDSIAERDRGYDYQQVVGDFAQIADLILILFDPHKAGTVREAHASLRDTLPARTFEDRVRFVLNRVDECQQLSDLIRVYGTLCWNLSQMTGRKDIPKIHLTYASQASQPSDYLKYLDNERAQLVNVVRSAPELRLDHLVSYVELHAERLGHLVEALVTYTSRARRRLWRSLWLGFVISATFGFVATATAFWTAGVADPLLLAAIGCSTSLLVYFLWCLSAVPALQENFRSRQIVEVDELTDLSFQSRKDSWANVKAICAQQIKSKMLKRRVVRRQQKLIQEFISKKIPELRAALSEYHGLAKE
jgi:hypothetical protein